MSTRAKDNSLNIESQTFIQTWIAWIVGAVLVIAIAAYAAWFQIYERTGQDKWGQFGDFIGGSVNPIIGFFTILLLSVSLRQNQIALIQANTALAQAKEELKLTRVAIEQAAGLQKATEDALQDQIEIAKQSRDINNAIALVAYHNDNNKRAQDFYQEADAEYKAELDTRIKFNTASIKKLRGILHDETDRLAREFEKASD